MLFRSASRLQRAFRERAYVRLVLHQKDALIAADREWVVSGPSRGQPGSALLGSLVDPCGLGQIEVERGAAAELTAHRERAVELRDDAMREREAEPRPVAWPLGGEEGLDGFDAIGGARRGVIQRVDAISAAP